MGSRRHSQPRTETTCTWPRIRSSSHSPSKLSTQLIKEGASETSADPARHSRTAYVTVSIIYLTYTPTVDLVMARKRYVA
jgi:hypothetical protein